LDRYLLFHYEIIVVILKYSIYFLYYFTYCSLYFELFHLVNSLILNTINSYFFDVFQVFVISVKLCGKVLNFLYELEIDNFKLES
jgi:hypothetical protein